MDLTIVLQEMACQQDLHLLAALWQLILKYAWRDVRVVNHTDYWQEKGDQ